jgi:hypothetical protein
MSNQQQSIKRITEANQKAFGIFAVDLSPFKMQPMDSIANWLAPMTSAFSKAPSPNLDKSSSAKKQSRRRP